MYNYVTLVLLLAVPALGQMARGNARSRISGLHNHFAIPIDGGLVYSWGMNNPATTDCISNPNHVQNDASFTGSLSQATIQCGGSPTPPTVQATGLSIASGANALLQGNPSFPSGWTISATANPTAVNAAAICGLDNVNYNTNDTRQYQGVRVDLSASGDSGFLYEISGTAQAFTTAGATLTAGAWFTAIHRYTSASANSASIWINNKTVAGSWTIGSGTTALPAVQLETDAGTTHAGSVNCIGTIGYIVAHDHKVNESALGFIYRAFYRAMQFRGVSIP